MARSPNGLIIVGCGKAKIWKKRRGLGKVKAQDAYVGALYRSARAFAEKRGPNWLILSAKHGLLPPDQPISNYNVTIGDRGAITSQHLRSQWQRLRNKPALVICLASEKYVSLLRTSIPQSVLIRTPLDGMDLFECMHWFKSHS
jgi:cytoplasmic iron level regulating protein YaaA (DUF328/UPF0246 family)